MQKDAYITLKSPTPPHPTPPSVSEGIVPLIVLILSFNLFNIEIALIFFVCIALQSCPLRMRMLDCHELPPPLSFL